MAIPELVTHATFWMARMRDGIVYRSSAFPGDSTGQNRAEQNETEQNRSAPFLGNGTGQIIPIGGKATWGHLENQNLFSCLSRSVLFRFVPTRN